jgi:tRNA-binding protein
MPEDTSASNSTSPISFDTFLSVDIRAGTIIDVIDFPEARKPAYKLKIDFGELGILQSSAQITDLYEKDGLLNKQIVAVVNFQAKQIGKFISQVLVLGVPNQDGQVVLLSPDKIITNGNRVF